MKKILVIVLAVVLTLSLSLTSVALAAGGEEEIAVAQEAGQAWLDNTVELSGGEPPEWIGAHLTTPESYYGLNGKPSAYMFTIENDGEVVGHIIVGSSAYGYPVFEAADCPPPSIPHADEVISALKRDLAIDVESVGRPNRLLYLGFDNLFAVYRVGGQEAAVNLALDFAVPAANLITAMPSPGKYKANRKATAEAISDLLESSDYSSLSLPPSGYYCLSPMSYFCSPGMCWCGPASGVSIGRYYRDRGGVDYDNLPDDLNMYWFLFYSMKTYNHGGYTYGWDYGPGFLAMTTAYGYSNFEYYVDTWPTHSDYEHIVAYINSGWPTALCAFQFAPELRGDAHQGGHYFPPSGGHFVAIKGYQFPYSASVPYSIICTDSYSGSNFLYLDWDHMTTFLPPNLITIRDFCCP